MVQNVSLLQEINDLKKERHSRKLEVRDLQAMEQQKKNHSVEDMMEISEDNTEGL